MDGVMLVSCSIRNELGWMWLLVGAFEFESADCGELGLSPFTIHFDSACDELLVLCCESVEGEYTEAGASAIEISTCGVKKCIGGVALSALRFPFESPESL